MQMVVPVMSFHTTVLKMLLLLSTLTGVASIEHTYRHPKSCEHLTVPTATAYKSLTVHWMLDCVRQCSHDSSCLSATFDGSQTCYMFSDDQLNCTVTSGPGEMFLIKLTDGIASSPQTIPTSQEPILLTGEDMMTTKETIPTTTGGTIMTTTAKTIPTTTEDTTTETTIPTTTEDTTTETTIPTTTEDTTTETTIPTTTEDTTTETTIPTTTEDPVNTTPVTCLNSGTLDPATQTCKCYNGYLGDTCERIMMDCTEGFKSGHYKDDEFKAYFIKPTLAPEAFEVFCNMKEAGGATYIMMNTEWRDALNLNVDWNTYKFLIGSVPNANHWIGLQNIYYITTSRPQHLFVQVFSDIDWKGRWRKYENFKVEDESSNYRMTYSGSFPWTQIEVGADPDWARTVEWTPLGDSMIGLNGSAFSTFDRDNDLDAGRNCAQDYQGGWWYNACADCNPNGPIKDPRNTAAVDEAFWKFDFMNNRVPHIEMILKAV